VIDGVRMAGQRALLLRGWGALDALPPAADLFTLDFAPHDWLFPRCAAVVHHGGAGTTHAALRAGRPAVVCPFFGDQPFWGWRVAEVGAGPQPIPQRALAAPDGADRLAAALRAALTPAMQSRAAAFAALMRAEDGVAAAVTHLLPYFEARVRKSSLAQ
jgi:sterol 3beta-glucosyltransferase